MPLPPIDELSDEESLAKKPSGTPVFSVKKPWDARRRPMGFKKKLAARLVEPMKLRHVVSSRCACKSGDCLKPFHQNHHLFDAWVKDRRVFSSVAKLEQDQHVQCSVSGNIHEQCEETHFRMRLNVKKTHGHPADHPRSSPS